MMIMMMINRNYNYSRMMMIENVKIVQIIISNVRCNKKMMMMMLKITKMKYDDDNILM